MLWNFSVKSGRVGWGRYCESRTSSCIESDEKLHLKSDQFHRPLEEKRAEKQRLSQISVPGSSGILDIN